MVRNTGYAPRECETPFSYGLMNDAGGFMYLEITERRKQGWMWKVMQCCHNIHPLKYSFHMYRACCHNTLKYSTCTSGINKLFPAIFLPVDSSLQFRPPFSPFLATEIFCPSSTLHLIDLSPLLTIVIVTPIKLTLKASINKGDVTSIYALW